MILLPQHLFKQYRSFCADNGVSDNEFADHLKWLRYFLDFCEKHQVTGIEKERVELFLSKLRQKGQSEVKQQQASRAVFGYFDMISAGFDRQLPAQQAPVATDIPETKSRRRAVIPATPAFLPSGKT